MPVAVPGQVQAPQELRVAGEHRQQVELALPGLDERRQRPAGLLPPPGLPPPEPGVLARHGPRVQRPRLVRVVEVGVEGPEEARHVGAAAALPHGLDEVAPHEGAVRLRGIQQGREHPEGAALLLAPPQRRPPVDPAPQGAVLVHDGARRPSLQPGDLVEILHHVAHPGHRPLPLGAGRAADRRGGLLVAVQRPGQPGGVVACGAQGPAGGARPVRGVGVEIQSIDLDETEPDESGERLAGPPVRQAGPLGESGDDRLEDERPLLEQIGHDPADLGLPEPDDGLLAGGVVLPPVAVLVLVDRPHDVEPAVRAGLDRPGQAQGQAPEPTTVLAQPAQRAGHGVDAPPRVAPGTGRQVLPAGCAGREARQRRRREGRERRGLGGRPHGVGHEGALALAHLLVRHGHHALAGVDAQ